MNATTLEVLPDHALAMLPRYDHLSGVACQEIAARRVAPGVLFLTSSLQLIYKDQHAGHLCTVINHAQGVKTASGLLPPAVLDVCGRVAQLMKTAKTYVRAQDVQVRQLVPHPDTPVLIWGIGLPDPNHPDEGRILVLMEESQRRPTALLRAAQRRFMFTDRDTEVLQHLLKGWTNKQIANAMNIGEQAVKEHIRKLMMKTGSRTRAALVVAVITVQSHSTAPELL
ncbi:MAG TPA: helix-turn-helix domain-containing protein [Nitrospirales bacterium]|jgi:DNA-binding CsgD family transcriptional regulator